MASEVARPGDPTDLEEGDASRPSRNDLVRSPNVCRRRAPPSQCCTPGRQRLASPARKHSPPRWRRLRRANKRAARPAAPIRFATDWRAEAEHGGFYEALATGEYAKRGLDVTIVQGGPGVNVPQLLAAGSVEMGIGSNSFIVLNLAQQKVPVKAVAAFMQKDPQVLIAHPDAGHRHASPT